MKKQITIFAGAAIIVWLLLYWTSDRGGIGYFSPQTLEYCTQYERTTAILGIPIYRSRCEQHENELIKLLIDDGYVKPDHESTICWETVFHWNDRWRGGDGLLYSMLIRRRDEMKNWTLSHPKSAKVYWSELFRSLRSTDPQRMAVAYGLVNVWRKFDTPGEVRETVKMIEYELAR